MKIFAGELSRRLRGSRRKARKLQDGFVVFICVDSIYQRTADNLNVTPNTLVCRIMDQMHVKTHSPGARRSLAGYPRHFFSAMILQRHGLKTLELILSWVLA